MIPTNPFSAVVQLFATKYLPKPTTANLEVVQINLIMWLARPDCILECTIIVCILECTIIVYNNSVHTGVYNNNSVQTFVADLIGVHL